MWSEITSSGQWGFGQLFVSPGHSWHLLGGEKMAFLFWHIIHTCSYPSAPKGSWFTWNYIVKNLKILKRVLYSLQGVVGETGPEGEQVGSIVRIVWNTGFNVRWWVSPALADLWAVSLNVLCEWHPGFNLVCRLIYYFYKLELMKALPSRLHIVFLWKGWSCSLIHWIGLRRADHALLSHIIFFFFTQDLSK